MMKLYIAGMLVGASILAPLASANAATPRRATMTCQEFLSLDEVTRPKVLYWAEGVNHKGKPEDAVIDVDATNRLVPVIVQECKATPHASFWQKMDAEWHKIEGDVKRHM